MARCPHLVRLCLLSALLGAWGTAVQGQEPPYEEIVPAPPAMNDQAMMNGHGTPVPMDDAADHAAGVPLKQSWHLVPRLAENRPVRTAVHNELHRYGLGCYATIDTVGCTSCASELTFIFGSCRSFFGEPCGQGGGLNHPLVPSYLGTVDNSPTVPTTYGTYPYGPNAHHGGSLGAFSGSGCNCSAR